MLRRLRTWLMQLLISIDQLGHVILGAPKYIIVGGRCPNADETISSVVGRCALQGRPWALVCEPLINWLFFVIAGQRDHCRKCIGH
jgi:hypothetical protein